MHVGGAKAILWPAARLALQEVRIAGSMGFDPRNDMVLGSVRIGIGCVDVYSYYYFKVYATSVVVRKNQPGFRRSRQPRGPAGN